MVSTIVKEAVCKARCYIMPCEDNKYRPKLLDEKILYGYITLLLVLKLIVVPFFVYLPKTSFFADLTKTSLINLANQSRQVLGFGTLKENKVLNEAALMKAEDMFNNDYFSHQSPQGMTPWHWFELAGYNYKYAGENLAIGFIESADVNQAWMDSELHRRNILNPSYKEIGIAVLTGDFQGRETTVVVQLFGSPQTALAIAQNQSALPQENKPAVNATQTQTETSIEKPEQTESQTGIEVIAENQAQTETQTETSTKEITGQIASVDKKGQVLSSYEVADKKDDFMFNFLAFIASSYYELLQKIIYGSLGLVALLLVSTVIFDIFVYKAYQIEYKDVFLKALIFCVFLGILLLIDKDTITHLFHNGFVIL